MGVAHAEERVELLAERAVEALAAAVDLDGGEGAREAGEVHGAEAALADDGRREAARHGLHLCPRQLPRRRGGGSDTDRPLGAERMAIGGAVVVPRKGRAAADGNGRRAAAAPAAEETAAPLQQHR